MNNLKVGALKTKATELTNRSEAIKSDILGKVDELNKVNDRLSAVALEITNAINELAVMRDGLEDVWAENDTISGVIESNVKKRKKGGKA